MAKGSGPRGYLAQVVHWSDEACFDRRQMLVSLSASALPMGAALCLGRPAIGYVIALGAVLVAGQPESEAGERASLSAALLPLVAAVLLASALAFLPVADAVMIAVIMGAATLINYSVAAAVSGVRFIVLLVLSMGLIGAHGAHDAIALLFGIGALWGTLLQRLARKRPSGAMVAIATAPVSMPTPRQRRIHLIRMLACLTGWQYPLRLAGGLAAACALRDMWPRHHYDWIVLSVVLMTPRTLEHLPVAITQRSLGTLAGVGLAGTILHLGMPQGTLILLICMFSALTPQARRANYAAYCALSTPLILLAMDAAGSVRDAMLADRLVATLIGSAIVVGANLAMEGLLRLSVKARRQRP